MSYLTEFQGELERKLKSSETAEDIVRFVSEKILESYKNGLRAGEKGEKVIRSGKSRSRSGFGGAQ